ncbi:chorismate-binding protein [Runella sp. MFBS21]|uniref:chorismate-binding protein n=1 Tax=Runella sp. MFBS21 TaxID=3034018 RepID=UPI0023F9467A|nr:chorismate-binding protein [Runella sp. MFBS21]MDF7817286.1 chorismate-binding protein [Runella sp. MFBS21]
MTIENKLTQVALRPEAGWQAAQELGWAAVLWRLPRAKEKQLIINFNPELTQTKIVLEDLPAGFAVSPFLNLEGNDSFFIEADLYFRFGASNEVLAEQSNLPLTDPQRVTWENRAHLVDLTPHHEVHPLVHRSHSDVASASYIKSVEEAVAAIETGSLKKVVLSRTKEIELPSGLSYVQLFERLNQKYPNAFVSLVYLPHLDQVWLGATPETLVSVDREGIFRTVALAGTQPAFDGNGQLMSPKKAPWTQKEIEEQALVSRYIISCFKKIRVREYIEEGPKTVIAGNLMHLCSEYAVDTKEINFPEIGTVMLELLHPTSAVCGMPKQAALDFIQKHENYDRAFYSGFLGPVNVEKETNLFVNLRCMKIQQGIATLYAGGGITEDSDPQKEWQETELKCHTMLSVLAES